MENSNHPRNRSVEDLALVGQAQDHLEPPRRFAITYDVLFSIVCGVFVGGQALQGQIRPFVTVVVLLSFIALMAWWRRRLGWWVNGYTPRRARWIACAMLIPLLGLAYWAWAMPTPWVALTAGITGAAVAFAASRLWARAWRRERIEARAVA